MPAHTPVEERFWAKVVGGDYTECWTWTASLTAGGYGRFPNRQNYVAHRTAYELLIGPIPPGLQLDHLCRNRACVNPWHLEPVTQQVNLARGEGIKASVAGRLAKTHCPQGHPYDEANTIRGKNGSRSCRICRKRDNHAYRLRRKERAS